MAHPHTNLNPHPDTYPDPHRRRISARGTQGSSLPRSLAGLLVCALLLLTTSCDAYSAGAFSPTGTPQVTEPAETVEMPVVTVEVNPQEEVPETPLVLDGIEPVVETTALLPTPVVDPLRFIFPTPRPEPNSAWRPPLYPTPWAPTPYDHFFFSRPIGADVVNWPLADYRYGGVFFQDVVHTGIDIPAPRGASVLAAGPGKVTWAGYGLYALKDEADDPYGLAVAIKHDFGYDGMTLYTVYGHMDEILVTKGQRVEAGDVVGLVGDTGKVTGVHLHFEVRIGKNNFFGSRNPELWIAPPQGWGVLAGRLTQNNGDLLAGQNVQIHSYDTGQYWEVNSYGTGSTNSDPYYKENLVIGDLPAGDYEIWLAYAGSIYDLDVQVRPGLVTYFTFEGTKGFKTDLPKSPGADFLPPEAAPLSPPLSTP